MDSRPSGPAGQSGTYAQAAGGASSNTLHPNGASGGQPMSRQGNTSHPGSQPDISAISGPLPLKKKKHRGGKKRKNRRQSFAAPSESTVNDQDMDEDRRPSILDGPRPSAASTSFYRLKGDNRSNTSLESEALLDHREQTPFRPRRRSNSNSMFAHRPSVQQYRSQPKRGNPSTPSTNRMQEMSRSFAEEDEDQDDPRGDRTPLLSSSHKNLAPRPATSRSSTGFGANYGSSFYDRDHERRGSGASPETRKRNHNNRPYKDQSDDEDFDVNNPPSVPGSPKLGSLDDVMIAEEFSRDRDEAQDAIINIDGDAEEARMPRPSPPNGRRTGHPAERDVCFPGDPGMSEIGEEEDYQHPHDTRRSPRRRRRRQWPDLDVLDEWTREEKEERDAEQIRAKKSTEPVMVGGRLRNHKQTWHRQEDESPYRYTYFNETYDATIHSRTISELCQFGATFTDLFRPEPPELSDSESDEEQEESGLMSPAKAPSNAASDLMRGRSSLAGLKSEKPSSNEHSGSQTPVRHHSSQVTPHRIKRYGPRPTFWLDVLSPTESEMKVLAKAFGIHQLTVEDILVQEPREKVELFSNYYFVNYRSFEQDKDSEDYMEPVNIYVIVFGDGVLSFHFSMTPHPANVRRRIRQLNDYMSPSADWISYAIIDDVTDSYAPLVQQVEEEVDDIDDHILALHDQPLDRQVKKEEKSSFFSAKKKEKDIDARSEKSARSVAADEGGQMLRRVGECRKKVMSLYRLLGNKADVIKGFAKRCTEQWQVAPRSEIGLYLGDIQDHIVTMTGNLSHYENLLSRAHSNYLAQINIRTSERAEQTNDVLGKLTVLGTIVLPMNVVTGIWGMNCWVPGQDIEHDFTWFFGITGSLLAFGLVCWTLAKTLYGIV